MKEAEAGDFFGFLAQALASRAPPALSAVSISWFLPLGRHFAHWRQRVASPRLHQPLKLTYTIYDTYKDGFICKRMRESSP